MNCVKRPDNWVRTEIQSYSEFIAELGVAVWPVVARAQQGERMWRIGMLWPYAEGDPEANAWLVTFREELEKLGWAEGRNVRIDHRRAGLDEELGAAIRRGTRSQQSTMSAYQPSVLVTPPERSLLLSQCVLGQFEPKEGRCL